MSAFGNTTVREEAEQNWREEEVEWECGCQGSEVEMALSSCRKLRQGIHIKLLMDMDFP